MIFTFLNCIIPSLHVIFFIVESQIPHSKLWDSKLVNAASCEVFDPRGIRQIQEKSVPALGSLLAGINIYYRRNQHEDSQKKDIWFYTGIS